MSLAKFIDRENRFRRVFGMPEYNVNNITDDDAQEIFGKLDSNMSPENLACDGERPRSEQAALAKVYKKAFNELRGMGFSPKDTVYNI